MHAAEELQEDVVMKGVHMPSVSSAVHGGGYYG
jgi:hypothetical protein